MALEDEIVTVILAEEGTERRRRTDLNLIGGPSVTDRPALKRADLDFWGHVRVGVVELTITSADFAEPVPVYVDTEQLPAGAFVLGASVRLDEPFVDSGATASYIKADIGTAGDSDSILVDADLMSAAVDFYCSAASQGIAPHRHFITSEAVRVTLRSDLTYIGGATFSAGSCTVRVLYVVPASA